MMTTSLTNLVNSYVLYKVIAYRSMMQYAFLHDGEESGSGSKLTRCCFRARNAKPRRLDSPPATLLGARSHSFLLSLMGLSCLAFF